MYLVLFILMLTQVVMGDVSHPCHLKHFGCCSKPLPIAESDGFLDPVSFLDTKVQKRLPVLMKGAAKSINAFNKWTDDYLQQMGITHQIHVMSETVKKERRDQNTEHMSLDQFIKIYNRSSHYMVDSVPKELRHDVQLPFCIQCDALTQNLMDLVMWFSSGGTNSVAHTDSADNINCLIRGNKELYMIDPSKFDSDSLIDRPHGAYSGVDVDRVDLEKYPTLADAEFYHVKVEAGDCLYIPYKWIHQVRSTGSNLAINFWFYRGAVKSVNVNECRTKPDESLTADKVHLWSLEAMISASSSEGASYLRQFYGRIVSQYGGDFTRFSDGLIQMLGMMLANNEEGFMEIEKGLVRSPILQIFLLLDSDGTGILEVEELEQLNDSVWDSVRAHTEQLVDLIGITVPDENEKTKDEL